MFKKCVCDANWIEYVVIERYCCSSFEVAIQLHNISLVCTFQVLLQSHCYAGAVKMALFTFVISNILWFHWIHTTLVCIELCRVMTTNKLFCSHFYEILDMIWCSICNVDSIFLSSLGAYLQHLPFLHKWLLKFRT